MYLSLVGVIVAQTGLEVIAILVRTKDSTTEVVTAIHNVAYPWETIFVTTTAIWLATYKHLGMSQDVCIAGTAKGVIDTSVTQIYKGITGYDSFVTATIEIFCLCQILNSTFMRVNRRSTVEVYRGTVFWIKSVNIITISIKSRRAISV